MCDLSRSGRPVQPICPRPLSLSLVVLASPSDPQRPPAILFTNLNADDRFLSLAISCPSVSVLSVSSPHCHSCRMITFPQVSRLLHIPSLAASRAPLLRQSWR